MCHACRDKSDISAAESELCALVMYRLVRGSGTLLLLAGVFLGFAFRRAAEE